MESNDRKISLIDLAAVAKVVEGFENGVTVRMDEKESAVKKQLENEKNSKNDKDATNKSIGGSSKFDLEANTNWEDCDFETAISATGYGKYNVMIMALSVFPMLGCLFTTSTMSLIIPSAGCDLHLSDFHKGLLNAVTYGGMICSAFFWGFLSDTLGRQKLLVISFGLDAVFNLTAGLSQNFEILFVAKLFAGFICSGPYAILMAYMAECHAAKYRASIILWTGVFSALGTIGLPILAWVVIPQPWSVNIFSMYFPSWRIFLVICTIPSIISSITLSFQLESPKFLMSRGRNDEAMEAFQSMYTLNTGNPKPTFPVKSLRRERAPEIEKMKDAGDENAKSTIRYLKQGWQQVRPLFHAPHLRYALLLYFFQGGTLFGLNTLRLWMPQLFSSIMDNAHLSANATNVCEILKPDQQNQTEIDCDVYLVNGGVYINSMIIGAVTAVGSYAAGHLVKSLGKKWLIIACTSVAVVCCSLMYWATTANMMLALSSLFIALASITSTTIISVAVDLFPTSLRTMIVSLTMMFGRLGAMTGNLTFPTLLNLNCTVPFFLIAAVLCGAGVMVFFIPKTKGKALE